MEEVSMDNPTGTEKTEPQTAKQTDKEFIKANKEVMKEHKLQRPLPKKLITYGVIAALVTFGFLFSEGSLKFSLGDKVSLLFWMFSFLFVFIGLAVGIIFGDKNIRVMFLRNATKRNFGFVHFISRGRSVFTMIKNLDQDMIIDKLNRVWVIENERIFMQSDANSNFRIMGENVVTSGRIPAIFLDVDTMRPLHFYKDEIVDVEGKPLKPARVGAAIKTAIATELAKGLLGGKAVTGGIVVVLLIAGAAAYFGYESWTFNNDVMKPFIQDVYPVINQLKAAQGQPSTVNPAPPTSIGE